jgi:hypothetical protein
MKIAQWNPPKTVKKEEQGGMGLRKSNVDGVNLIKVHYMFVHKYCTEIPLYS